MRRLLTILAIVASCIPSAGSVRELAADSPAAKAVLQKNCIKAGTSGQLPLSFADIDHMLAQPELLLRAQGVYAEMLPAGRTPTVQIKQLDESSYETLNANGQTTAITEVYRSDGSKGEIDSVYHVRAKRFFGVFEAVIHINARQFSAEETIYRVDVYAYPHNLIVRSVTRRLHLVEKFFDEKTSHLTSVITRLGQEMLIQQDVAALTTPRAN